MNETSCDFWLAANNGDIGGGEVMLLRAAEALRSLGRTVGIVAPASPDGVVRAAREAGFHVEALPATGRRDWMQALRRWDRTRVAPLWCHGLVPSVATAGHQNRIVEIHQPPATPLHQALVPLACLRARRTLVPSQWMMSQVRGAEVLANWTDDVELHPRGTAENQQFRVGFLGRVTPAKGVEGLVKAIVDANKRSPGRFRLLIAGETRFASAPDRLALEKLFAVNSSHVEKLGWIAREDLFARIDALVVPSIAEESFGLTTAEAMAARVPVIVTDSGALAEVAGPPHATIVPAGDARALAKSIENLADNPDAAGVDERYARWQREYSPEAGRERVRALLESLNL